MVFSSLEFLGLFLPLTLLGVVLLTGRARMALGWLVLCSLFFYGYWNPAYLVLLLASVLCNFAVAGGMTRNPRASRLLLMIGVTANLAAIAWFKYAGFMASNVNWLFGTELGGQGIILPLAISFFTFQQIAFLVDVHRGIAREYDLIEYTLFVCFFPQLIAGPIVHHKEIIPQFRETLGKRITRENLQIGITVLLIGLFKKVVIADGLASVATPLFELADQGAPLTSAQAWLAAVCYTFQLYFDFSGYSDMAIGAARLFGIRLPENFNSPYKSLSIIDFWRRWHITLSRFLQEYLYIPLGGNRKGPSRRLINLMITMLLGGLWHGAGWTLVFWGGLHGTYLVINHTWSTSGGQFRELLMRFSLYRAMAWTLCFVAVVVAWVFFRAESFAGAWTIVQAMGRLADLPSSLPDVLAATPYQSLLTLALAAVVAWLLPNVQEWMVREDLVLTSRRINSSWLVWTRSGWWAVAAALPAAVALYKMIYLQNRVSEFIYFQF